MDNVVLPAATKLTVTKPSPASATNSPTSAIDELLDVIEINDVSLMLP